MICVFVFAYAKSRFSHDTARIVFLVSKSEKSGVSLASVTQQPGLSLTYRETPDRFSCNEAQSMDFNSTPPHLTMSNLL